jgi:hypothetical protein
MLPLLGLAGGIIGGIGKLIGRGKANRQMEKLLAQNPAYKENPLARERLGLARQLLNARMPGAVQAERNIFSTQANQLSNINRGATDASQALALGAGVQGQTNDSIQDLGMSEAQDYQRRYQNLGSAQQGVIQEGDKVFQDKIRRFNDMASIRGAQNANRQNSWGDVSNMGFGLMNFGLAGGFKNMLGGGGNRGGNNAGQGGLGNIDMSWYNPGQPRDVPLEQQ